MEMVSSFPETSLRLPVQVRPSERMSSSTPLGIGTDHPFFEVKRTIFSFELIHVPSLKVVSLGTTTFFATVARETQSWSPDSFCVRYIRVPQQSSPPHLTKRNTWLTNCSRRWISTLFANHLSHSSSPACPVQLFMMPVATCVTPSRSIFTGSVSTSRNVLLPLGSCDLRRIRVCHL
jgi:hypothetical protein